MVYRVYVEKKKELANEAAALLGDARNLLGIDTLEDVRILNRYDAENITAELFEYAIGTVFSEPQLDIATAEVSLDGATVFAVEYLPGQFDQRADSAAQCIQIISQGDRPLIRSAKVYALYGNLTDEQIAAIKSYVINPVEAREASFDKPETLAVEYALPSAVATVTGFVAMDEAALANLLDELGLAMDLDDLKFLQAYFRDEEGRDPTITEIRVVDTYWSDHCRHTTFSTHFENVRIDDPAVQAAYERYLAARVEVYGEEKAAARPQTLMDIATIATKVLKKRGLTPSAVRRPVSAAASVIRCRVAPTSIRPCVSPARAIPARPSPTLCPASCRSARSARRRRRAIPPTVTRSVSRPVTWQSCTTTALWRSASSAAPWSRRLPPITCAVSAPLRATWWCCSAAVPVATASAALPAPRRAII